MTHVNFEPSKMPRNFVFLLTGIVLLQEPNMDLDEDPFSNSYRIEKDNCAQKFFEKNN